MTDLIESYVEDYNNIVESVNNKLQVDIKTEVGGQCIRFSSLLVKHVC